MSCLHCKYIGVPFEEEEVAQCKRFPPSGTDARFAVVVIEEGPCGEFKSDHVSHKLENLIYPESEKK